ncbi:FxsB family radical SAM/SPASM domain protein [Streptosporangium sp. NBC_01755]|uniref:FxsB family cyclophane-forming radical SAM/SPASM peptide maturase n=1 Tax=Streptosporangium sp. NBC_01755 TaxID=2975949 RepID=UPI002DDB1B74|nr:FxsB family cyclophane-forming radical SAM/SPASM peptide maturase [Streptosporangium sp. NBC_01755]WSD00735.1 FxsB family radical SAM/SPASM domain protein [Streptosporangium sp. NBC_01755]
MPHLSEKPKLEILSPENAFPATLDVAGLLASGWRPSAFRQFILKIHSRCDLACRHCYIYEMADQSWKAQPRRMSEAIVNRTAQRIAEHALAHELAEVEVILHGGEPLLAGPELISHAVRTIRGAAADVGTRVHVGVQTNGLRLDETYLRLFDSLEVRVGVSMDGYEAAHDRHRLFTNGKGSHAMVTASLRRLTAGPFHHLFSGLLCTIDIRNDPLATYEALLEFDPPAVDFLLPHGNWLTPPPFRDPDSAATPYADWLLPIFDRWYGAAVEETEIRFFNEIVRLLTGRASRTEAIGLSPARMVVIETNGSIEQSDILKSSYHGAPATLLHVLRDSFDTVLEHPSIVARQIGELALAPVCQACDIRSICGGGLYPHRYSEARGFLGPSVYCPDLYRLIDHIRARLLRDVARLKGSG